MIRGRARGPKKIACRRDSSVGAFPRLNGGSRGPCPAAAAAEARRREWRRRRVSARFEDAPGLARGRRRLPPPLHPSPTSRPCSVGLSPPPIAVKRPAVFGFVGPSSFLEGRSAFSHKRPGRRNRPRPAKSRAGRPLGRPPPQDVVATLAGMRIEGASTSGISAPPLGFALPPRARARRPRGQPNSPPRWGLESAKGFRLAGRLRRRRVRARRWCGPPRGDVALEAAEGTDEVNPKRWASRGPRGGGVRRGALLTTTTGSTSPRVGAGPTLEAMREAGRHRAPVVPGRAGLLPPFDSRRGGAGLPPPCGDRRWVSVDYVRLSGPLGPDAASCARGGASAISPGGMLLPACRGAPLRVHSFGMGGRPQLAAGGHGGDRGSDRARPNGGHQRAGRARAASRRYYQNNPSPTARWAAPSWRRPRPAPGARPGCSIRLPPGFFSLRLAPKHPAQSEGGGPSGGRWGVGWVCYFMPRPHSWVVAAGRVARQMRGGEALPWPDLSAGSSPGKNSEAARSSGASGKCGCAKTA